MSAAMLDDTGLIVACPSCGKKNRIPIDRLGQVGVCGACKSKLPALAEPVEVSTEDRFERLVRGSTLPVLVDFWAPWCGPCRMVAPEVAKVAAAQAGSLVVAKVNTEALPTLGSRYSVSSIPMMALFTGGREVARIVGARPAAEIERFVRDAAAAKR